MNEQLSFIYVKFYKELNDFLLSQNREMNFVQPFKGRVSIKDLIESLGVPHTEIGLISVDGKRVDFAYHVKHQDYVNIYPMSGEMLLAKISRQHSKPLKLLEPLKQVKFVLDTHLGKLAKYLRMLGFDSLYQNNYSDADLARLSSSEQRILLTRDRNLLKHRIVNYGHFVRNTKPCKQLQEIITWLNLKQFIKPFARCMRCNGLLLDVEKCEIEENLKPKTKRYYHQFKQCQDCGQVYWRGSHCQNMLKLITTTMNNTLDC